MSQKSLKKQVVGGIAWRGSTDIIQQVLQIVFTIVLARLLTKADFGLVAMAMLVNRFVKAMTSIGFGAAIVHSQEISKGQISAIFYVQLALNSLLTGVIYFGAGIAADFFEEPELVPIIQAIAFVIFLQTFQFPNILLRKRMDFKGFSIAEIVSMISANIIAIIMALYGYGVWSLVWRLLLQRFIFGVLSFTFGKWLPSKPEFKGVKPLFKFGLNMLGTNIVYFFAENMIGLLTGRFLGKDAMGLFNIAYNLAIVPASKIKTVMTSVLTAGFSKLQYELERFKKNYTKALNITALFFIPIMAVLGGTATNMIPIIYGDKWSEAGNYLMILALVGLLRGLVHILRSALLSKGLANVIFRSSIVEILTSLPLMYLLLPHYDIYGLMIGYTFGAFFSWVYVVYFYDRAMGESWLAFKSIKAELILGGFIAIIIYSISLLDLNIYMEFVAQLFMALLLFVSYNFMFNNYQTTNFIHKFKFGKSKVS